MTFDWDRNLSPDGHFPDGGLLPIHGLPFVTGLM
jgi:hypothetical protein